MLLLFFKIELKFHIMYKINYKIDKIHMFYCNTKKICRIKNMIFIEIKKKMNKKRNGLFLDKFTKRIKLII